MKWTRLAILLLAVFSQAVAAEVNINGFLSVSGGTLVDDDEIATQEGYDGDWNTDPDTTFGLQFTAPINDKVTATGQLLARGIDDYDIEAEWAYMSYAISDNWDVRAGRLRAPFFVYSDFLDVGYAYPFIAPPANTYRLQFSTVEGVDTIVRGSLGDWDSTFQAFYGRLTDDYNLGGEVVDLDLVGFTGLNWTLTRDWLTLRAAYTQSEFTFQPTSALSNAAGTGLLDILTASGFAGVADALNMSEEDSYFYGLGFSVDYNDWIVIGEVTGIELDEQSLISDDQSAYLLVGKRFGSVTLHATWDWNESDPDYGIVDPIPSGVDPALDALKAVVAGSISDTESNDYTLGVRYDFAPGTAFKFEIKRINRESRGIDTDGALVRFAIDMVF